MSIDIVSAIEIVTFFIAFRVLFLGTFRAIRIGRTFVSAVYRNKAYWTAAVMVIIFVDLLNPYIPYPSPASLPVTGLLPTLGWFLFGVLGALPFSLLFLVLFAFVDRTILVAMETDFFHRNTLRWRNVRRPLFGVLIAVLVVAIFIGSYYSLVPNPPSWTSLILGPLFLGAFGVGFPYLAIALIVASRRTPDRTLKMHVRFIGLAIVGYIGATIISSGWGIHDVITSLVDAFFVILGGYALYRSVMSLSPLGRVAKEGEAPPKPVQAMNQT